ncbi:MAG: DUF4423 domain-containing protein, partial [Oligoflexia bacterium]|nr:DUF4423 domain-containing protein [Oligoflexia bacterium]
FVADNSSCNEKQEAMTNIDNENYRLMANKFMFKINPSEIAKSINLLVKLGLLTRDSQNKLKQTHSQLKISSQIKNFAIQHYHQQTLSLAKEAITKIAPEDREITNKILTMNFNKIEEAKNFIKEFKEKFSTTYEVDDGDTIFQLQIQLFPITKKEI